MRFTFCSRTYKIRFSSSSWKCAPRHSPSDSTRPKCTEGSLYQHVHRATARALRPTQRVQRVHFASSKCAPRHSESDLTRPKCSDGSLCIGAMCAAQHDRETFTQWNGNEFAPKVLSNQVKTSRLYDRANKHDTQANACASIPSKTPTTTPEKRTPAHLQRKRRRNLPCAAKRQVELEKLLAHRANENSASQVIKLTRSALPRCI